MKFCKLQGFGNDYIVFEAEELKNIPDARYFAVKVCNRHTGIGGDGIAVLEKLLNEPADYSCRIINPDGSEASFSGNGTRCAVAYLYYKNLWDARNLRLQTMSGLKNYELLSREKNTFWFRAELGKPRFELPQSEFFQAFSAAAAESEDNFLSNSAGFALGIDNHLINLTFIDVGNPVAVVLLNNFDEIDWRRLGGKIENLEFFPERTNVVFVKTIDKKNIEIRIWERGAGETSSSGTCSMAAAVAHLKREKLR
ncbi:MAG: diaminopimelate epimerase, partial [Pyrinomonadaceae bacterium]